MNPTAIISEIETIRLHDFQVCQKINLIETQILRLKRSQRTTNIDQDSTFWFQMEAETERLCVQQQKIDDFTEILSSRFDSEIQKLNEACERQTKRLRRELGCDQIQDKAADARERLAQAREELTILRNEQANLTQRIDAERRRVEAQKSAIAEMQQFLKSGRALRQCITRLNVSQNQLQALDKRIVATKAKQAPRQTPPNTGGNRIPPPQPNVNGASRLSNQHASNHTGPSAVAHTDGSVIQPPSTTRLQARPAAPVPSYTPSKPMPHNAALKGRQSRQPIVNGNNQCSMRRHPEPPAARPQEPDSFYESVWTDDFDDFMQAPEKAQNSRPLPPQRQAYSLSVSDDDDAIYLD